MASLPTIVPPTTNDDKNKVTMDPYKQPPQSNPLANHPALDLNVLHQQPQVISQPPQLRTPLASEPADQWASSTIQAVADDSIGASSAVSTPGPQIPGAYPTLLPSAETVQKDLEYAKEVAASALNTATEYAAQAGQTVAAALSSAKQSEAAQSAAQTASEGANVAGQAAVGAQQAVAQTASSAAQTTADTARSATQTAAQTASSAAQTASQTASSATQTTIDTTKATGNSLVSGVSAAPQVALDTAKSAPQAAANTAKSAGSTVTETVKNVGATAAQYLPAAIASYLPGNQTTTEHHSTAIKPFVHHSTAVADPTGNMKNGLEALEGTSFAKLPAEATVNHSLDSHYPSASTTAVTDPTGNPSNGLEALHGSSLAKLPEERNAVGPTSHVSQAGTVPFDPAMQNTNFGASYLNPNLVLAPHPSTTLPSTTTAPADGASTHHPAATPGGADTDASIRSLAGSSIVAAQPSHQTTTTTTTTSSSLHPSTGTGALAAEKDVHRGTFENKPLHESQRGGVDPYVETLRAHDAAKRSRAGVTETVVEPVNERKEGGERLGERKGDRHAGTGESKPVHESHRAPSVPAKDTSPHASTTATSGAHSTASEEGSSGSGNGNGNGGGNGGKRSSGFMSKVKGEMKVLSGKLTHSEEKVEEGRRLMGKN